MSLWNPYAFTPTGQPVAPVAPPALRVIGGQASAQQLGMAQQAFVQFSERARLSAVPNPVEAGCLPDGTPYKIIDVAGVRTMMIWPVNIQPGLRSGIWFWTRKNAYQTGDKPNGKFLVNRRRQDGGSSANWELVPFPDPFFGLDGFTKPAIQIDGRKGWNYSYHPREFAANSLGQYGRVTGVTTSAGTFSDISPTGVIGSDALRIKVYTSYYSDVVEVIEELWRDALTYRVPREANQAVQILPSSYATPIQRTVLPIPNALELQSMFGSYGSTHFSKDKKYAAFGFYRKKIIADEVAHFYSHNNYYMPMLLNVASTVAITAFSKDNDYNYRVVTRPDSYEISSEEDKKVRNYLPEMYVFKLEEGGYVFDHLDEFDDTKDATYTNAIASQLVTTKKYQSAGYSCEVLQYVYPFGPEGFYSGPINIELKADFTSRSREFCGVDNEGNCQYVISDGALNYHTDKNGYYNHSTGVTTGTSVGTYTSYTETSIFGKTLVTRDDKLNATYSYGSGRQSSYQASSEVRRIAHVVSEIELFVYVHQKATYQHSSSVTFAGSDAIVSPSSALPVFTKSELVIECKDKKITIAAPITDTSLINAPSCWVGLMCGIGDIAFGEYRFKNYGNATPGGAGSPLSPGPITIYNFGGKQYSSSAGFVQINGLSGFTASISHCFVPETGGVCLHISIPQYTGPAASSAVTTERTTYYFLYDDEAGLREMPVEMQDEILNSLELSPGNLPPNDHMAQI